VFFKAITPIIESVRIPARIRPYPTGLLVLVLVLVVVGCFLDGEGSRREVRLLSTILETAEDDDDDDDDLMR
jgi:hypothetical protein